jgi:hypothetical protein
MIDKTTNKNPNHRKRQNLSDFKFSCPETDPLEQGCTT